MSTPDPDPDCPSTPTTTGTETYLSGGCHCGANTYQLTLPAQPSPPFPLVDFDHCTSCRRTSGALLQAWIILPQSWAVFHISSTFDQSHTVYASSVVTAGALRKELGGGEPKSLVHYASSPGVSRAFCARCGTHLVYSRVYEEREAGDGPEGEGDGEDFVGVSLASLDKDSLERAPRPLQHTWWGDGVPWLKEMIAKGCEEGGIGAMEKLEGYQ
ncbi:Mss4-like protein [Tricharina praecox]|uniref:Mss4-like protein n=1 Tax=Tricharina praecox TaxID=43433 RepID=UPI00222085CD|nr:Mss4-like protein [Tricharina praecox]KAI5846692.1 Mss4-like protein [Tricharina praecox]